MKEFLSREGHPFVERDVDADDTAYDALIALGWRAVPVTIINGTAVGGFDEVRLRALLSDAGEP